ncbi:16S rRNA (uracil(1498)-N(3))-methyltransferase [Breoghania sp.]|uniref:16S rRNA (uracil(1498)-N(3))-methyltransferase n=1 Tax=Breoghania sp. TaxID=2065378 RepID=UPI002AA7FDD8|nr:16S rRNA (uracil(1498)-N(3))-methyltransferase [Breoghania sp.]
MPRLYLDADLAEGRAIELDRAQSNYLLNVMRLKDGAGVLVFNGRDGEWRAEIAQAGRKACTLTPCELMRAQDPLPDLVYCFAPLKHARLDYMVQKAAEMGAGALQPVMTRFTQSGRINLDRARANVIEACEQCGVIAVPEIREPVTLDRLVSGWQETEPGRRLIFCDEGEESQNPLEALEGLERGPLAVLIGPEGGFAEDERELLRRQDYVAPVPLGPRVLRADTAAVAALAIVQALLGDWR